MIWECRNCFLHIQALALLRSNLLYFYKLFAMTSTYTYACSHNYSVSPSNYHTFLKLGIFSLILNSFYRNSIILSPILFILIFKLVSSISVFISYWVNSYVSIPPPYLINLNFLKSNYRIIIIISLSHTFISFLYLLTISSIVNFVNLVLHNFLVYSFYKKHICT